ncbi:MAG TPA: outer membrane beta-barrel protein [Candidatus Polarisedimenticolia bacterium]|jgi:outer membrane protein W|nr:outer membrane beta-barrel protein [Candidatus Polarisedimenticolia bacterium]
MFKARSVILALAVVAVFASAPALAQDHSFRVFVTADWVSPNGEDDITVGSVTDAVQGSDDFGYEAGFEWRMNKLFGLEGSFLAGSNDFEFGNTDVGSLDQKAITAALNFHILPTTIFDLWIAPVASWYNFGDLDDGAGGNINIDSQWGYGAQVGFDIGFGKTFAITGGVRYIKIDLQGDGSSDSAAFDPIIARAGVAFRFGSR